MKLPKEIFEQHIAVLGKTGSGKSSVLRLMVEQLLDDKQPVCIIDPKGDWWGLKSSASGKSAGYPVVIFGGEHADVPINAHSGAHVAELIATGNRPCIIDLGGWMVGERTRFFVDFASTMFRTTRGKRYIVIDEVHNFAPQGKVLDPDAGKMLHWANRLASEGRGKGLTILSASQRPQKVHKDFLTCAETLIAMRVIHKLDRDAIKDWIDGAGDPDKGREVLATLAGNERGEAWVWSPEIKFGPKRIKFPMFGTYDSFAPKANDGTAKLKGWASVDLAEVSAKLAKVVEEAKANDPAELKKQIAELKRAKPVAQVVGDPKAVERAVAERDRFWKPQLLESEKHRKTAVTKLQRIHRESTLNGEASWEPTTPPAAKVFTEKVNVSAMPSTKTFTQKVKETSAVVAGDVKITKTELNVMRALYWAKDDKQVDSRKVAFFAGYSPNASTVSAAMSNLRKAGYAAASGYQLTAEGLAAIPADIEAKPTGDDLRNWIRGKVGAAENAILDFLLQHPDEYFESAAIAEATGYSPTASTISACLSVLRKFEAVEGKGRGGVKAAAIFFED